MTTTQSTFTNDDSDEAAAAAHQPITQYVAQATLAITIAGTAAAAPDTARACGSGSSSTFSPLEMMGLHGNVGKGITDKQNLRVCICILTIAI